MLKVICINEKWIKPAAHQDLKGPVFLQECEVKKSILIPKAFVSGEYVDGVYYVLDGFGDTGYHASHFATLPTADADEMNEVEQEGIVNIEKQLVWQR